jgi:hypothetical protein
VAEDASIRILKRRYAKGEITKAEYDQMKADLSGVESEPASRPTPAAKYPAPAARMESKPINRQMPMAKPSAPATKKGSNLATGVGIVVVLLGLFLGFGFFLNAIHYNTTTTGYTTTISSPNTTNGTFSAATVTNSSGEIVYTSNGNRTVFRFVDQKTGIPLNGLVVGIAINDSDGLGTLFTIDPRTGQSRR